MQDVQGNAVKQGNDSFEFAADMWARMALPAAPTETPAEELRSPGLRLALSILEEGALGAPSAGSHRMRTVPSAGAIYPYEFAVIAVESGVPAIFRVDADRRSCTRLAGGPEVAEALDASGLAIPADGGAVIIALTRAWLSMRKYGDRGYLYTELDAGHAVGNLLLATTGRGAAGELRLRLPRAPLAEVLEADETCREIHSAVLVPAAAGDSAAHGGPSADWTLHEGTDRSSREHVWRSWLETACWESFAARADRVRLPQLPVQPTPLIDLDRTFAPEAAGLGEPATWPQLLAARRSSKAFVKRMLPADTIRQAVSALSTPISTDLPSDSPVSATLIVRSAEPEHNVVVSLSRPGARAVRVPSTAEVIRACMQQRHLAEAAAFVLLHVPRTSLSGDNAENLRELTFRCGALGQLLYLGAARAGIGVTGIGGFDADLWHSLAGLPEGDEVFYVLLLGSADDSGIKLDRLATAHAQNER